MDQRSIRSIGIEFWILAGDGCIFAGWSAQIFEQQTDSICHDAGRVEMPWVIDGGGFVCWMQAKRLAGDSNKMLGVCRDGFVC